MFLLKEKKKENNDNWNFWIWFFVQTWPFRDAYLFLKKKKPCWNPFFTEFLLVRAFWANLSKKRIFGPPPQKEIILWLKAHFGGTFWFLFCLLLPSFLFHFIFHSLFLCISLVILFSSFLFVFLLLPFLSLSLFALFLCFCFMKKNNIKTLNSICSSILSVFGFPVWFCLSNTFSLSCFLILSFVFCLTSMFSFKKDRFFSLHQFLVKRGVATKLF